MEMVPATNVINARAQYFVIKRRIATTHPANIHHTALAHQHTTPEMVHVFSLRSSRTLSLSQPEAYLAAKVMRPPRTPAASNCRQNGYF